ncbi:MAG: ABC transporter ATP-binding protein [Nitrospinaceae bacterium]
MTNSNRPSENSSPQTSELGAWGILIHFGPLLWSKRKSLAASYFLNLIAVGAVVISPWPLKILIDNVLGTDPLPAFLQKATQGISPTAMVASLALGSAFIVLIMAGAAAWGKLLNARIRETLVLELRDRLLGHLQILSHTLRLTHRSGELVLRLIDDVNQIIRLITRTLPIVFRHLMGIVTTFAVMFWVEPRLAAMSAVIMLVLGLMVGRYTRPLQKASRVKRTTEGATASLAQEIVRGMQTVQVLGLEASVRKRFKAANSKSLAAGVDELRAAVNMERTLQAANGMAVGLIMAGGGIFVLQNHITVGELTVFVAYIVQLLKPIEKINELASAVARGVARGEMVLALLTLEPAVQETAAAVKPVHTGHLGKGPLELRNVSFSYAPGSPDELPQKILDNVNLRLERGKLAVLTGPSGAGKSTLLNLLLRLFDPLSGKITLGNVPYRQLPLETLRRQFAVMLQDTHLFAGSLRDVLQPPDKELKDRHLWQALELVSLENHIHQIPHKLDAQLGEEGLNFSGGQRARLSLARAFLLDRPILLLDEPLANVDVDSQKIIMEALDSIRKDRMCLVMTHQLSLLEKADVVLKLENHKIFEISGQPPIKGKVINL